VLAHQHSVENAHARAAVRIKNSVLPAGNPNERAGRRMRSGERTRRNGFLLPAHNVFGKVLIPYKI